MTEKTPKTWLLVQTVADCLRPIRQDAGYFTDIGLYVTTEPTKEPLPTDKTPVLCVVVDANARPDDPGLRTVGRSISLLVVTKIPSGFDEAQLMQHQAADDIELAMQSEATRALFAPGMQRPMWQETNFINRVDGLAWVGVAVRYTAQITRKF